MFTFRIDQLVAELTKEEYDQLIATLEDDLFPNGIDTIVDWDENILNILFTTREWLFSFDPDFPLTITCSPIQMGLDDVMKLKYSPLRNLLFHIRKVYGEMFDDKSNFIYRCKYEHGRVHLTHRWMRSKIRASEPETTPRKSPHEKKRKRQRIIDENAMHADDVKGKLQKNLLTDFESTSSELFKPIHAEQTQNQVFLHKPIAKRFRREWINRCMRRATLHYISNDYLF